MTGLIVIYIVCAILGAMSFIGGFALNYWMRRRAFYRRNVAGIEEFRSFEHAEATGCMESMARFVAVMMMIGGATSVLALVPNIIILLV